MNSKFPSLFKEHNPGLKKKNPAHRLFQIDKLNSTHE